MFSCVGAEKTSGRRKNLGQVVKGEQDLIGWKRRCDLALRRDSGWRTVNVAGRSAGLQI